MDLEALIDQLKSKDHLQVEGFDLIFTSRQLLLEALYNRVKESVLEATNLT
jgi:hypothetical protein